MLERRLPFFADSETLIDAIFSVQTQPWAGQRVIHVAAFAERVRLAVGRAQAAALAAGTTLGGASAEALWWPAGAGMADVAILVELRTNTLGVAELVVRWGKVRQVNGNGRINLSLPGLAKEAA